MQPRIVEAYHDYDPPIPLVPIIEDLVRCVPKEHWAGLNRIVLTDAAGQPRRDRRRKSRSRKRKVALNEARGFYQPAWQEDPPFIQLHLDVIIGKQTKPRRLLARMAAPWIWRNMFAHVLYHELGHHIHYTQDPRGKETENVAEDHMWTFLVRLIRKRWYLFLLLAPSMILSGEFWRGLAYARKQDYR